MIHNYTLPVDYNETRRGYVDTGFMEEIVSNRTNHASGGLSVPVAQIGPRLMDTSVVMLDLFSHPVFKKEIAASLEYDVPVVSELEDLEFLLRNIDLNSMSEENIPLPEVDYSAPRSFTLDPVRAGFDNNDPVIGFIVGVIQWTTFFKDILPEDINGMIVEVESDCGRSFTYIVNGGRKDEWNLNNEAVSEPVRKYQYLQQR